MKRWHFFLLASSITVLGFGGCSWFNGLTMRSQSPDEPEPESPRARLIGDIAVPYNIQPVRVDAVGLVTGLHGTGSDPVPGPERQALLEEMQTRGVTNPTSILASNDVSLVLVQGLIRPGIQQGEHFDIEVRVPDRSETTSLRGGFLLETRLSESAVLGGRLHRDKLLALAKGPVMVDPTADAKKDKIMTCRGRVLGGGVALKSRPMGLVIIPEHKDVRNSSRVANAVNKRFNIFEKGVKTGMAKAKTDDFIELTVFPRYKDNIERYIMVIRALAISESSPERMKRIKGLEAQLLDPTGAAEAAIQLEAIGADGAESLLKGIKSKDVEVRFYAAEALAYLDRREAAEPLAEIARDQPAFRVFALTALSVMQQDNGAYEQLRGLLSSPSAETRYGAFRALWTMNPRDSLVKGDSFGGQFNYHALDVSGPPMIHVTRSRVAEIVVFGRDQRFLTPLAVNAGNDILVKSNGGDEIVVSKYSVKDGDQKRTVSSRVDDVIRAVVELGGTYPDVVQAVQEAKNMGALSSRLEVDALPEAGRAYERIAQGEKDQSGEQSEATHVKSTPTSPVPELFLKREVKDRSADADSAAGSSEKSDKDSDSDESANTKKGFFARMFGR
jgi:flagellar basal body P-ring protein FlgI